MNNIKKIFSSILFLGSALTNSGCISKAIEAAIPQKGKVADKLTAVKTVAIVAFDTMMYVPAGVASHVGTLGTMNTVANLKVVESSEAKNLYLALQQTLKDQGYKVISLDHITSNTVYQRIYSNKNGKITEKELQSSSQPHTIKGLLRAANPEYMFEIADVQELKKALAVDAIITGRLRYSSIENSTFSTGFNSRYLLATFAYHMFDGSQDKPIWFDYGFTGPMADESIGRIYGHEDKELISKLTIPVGTNAINAFFK